MAAIEKLVDAFIASDGTAYYQVKWKPTWERADALAEYHDLINDFWKSINRAHSSNVHNNQSSFPRRDPVIPNSIQRHVPNYAHSAPNISHVNNGNATLQRSKSVSSGQQKATNSLPSPSPSVKSNPLTPRGPSISSMNNVQPFHQKSTVVIDSDEENDLSNMVSQKHQNQSPPQQMLSCQWEQQIKSEPMDIKPFQESPFPQSPRQQQPQFNFNTTQMPNNPFYSNNEVLNSNPSPSGRGLSRGRGSGTRGRGSRGTAATPTKRKLSVPAAGSPTSKQQFGNVKTEAIEQDGILLDGTSPSWKDSFETIEHFVNGQRASQSFRCKVCGTHIAQRGNAARHFKIHTKEQGMT